MDKAKLTKIDFIMRLEDVLSVLNEKEENVLHDYGKPLLDVVCIMLEDLVYEYQAVSQKLKK